MKKNIDTPYLARKSVKLAFASNGAPFNPMEDLWAVKTLSGAVNIDFTLLRVLATEEFVTAAKIMLKSQ